MVSGLAPAVAVLVSSPESLGMADTDGCIADTDGCIADTDDCIGCMDICPSPPPTPPKGVHVDTNPIIELP